MGAFDNTRLSVVIIDVNPGRDADFASLSDRLKELLERKQYCTRADALRDEAMPSRYYGVRQWVDADAARRSHSDPEMSELRTQLYQLALVTYVVNGVRTPGKGPDSDERRTLVGRDRRIGFDRRAANRGPVNGERRAGRDRRIGPRRTPERAADLVGAARRARENADATFSHFKVGAAIETIDGTVVTGCNIENATYGLTMCAERVAMFKALSDGHRAFARIAIVADSQSPTLPCGACRQILWEFGGNLVIHLANLTAETGTHRLGDLLPLPFDARLLKE